MNKNRPHKPNGRKDKLEFIFCCIMILTALLVIIAVLVGFYYFDIAKPYSRHHTDSISKMLNDE